ncbi:MAG: flagellar motor protein MotB [Candidatus Marinimicrobia bacterium]|nr:flagellar motor protein MotB [Candidatus Neomarinimicrobiota bacterium]
MKMTIKYLVATTLTGVLFFSCTGNQAMLAEKQSTIDSLQQQFTGMRQQLERDKVELKQLEELAALQREVETKDTELDQALSELAKIKDIRVINDRTIITHNLLFQSGSYQISKQGEQLLQKIATVLKKYPNRKIIIEGHTDDRPIAPEYKEVYRSNWDLSTFRALAVLYYFRDQTKLPEANLRVMAAGEFQPNMDNDSDKSREQNRRVEIIVGPKNR